MDRETDVLNGGPDTLWTRLGLSRPELRAWALYDWANSAFQTTVITAVFPPFFATFAAAGLPAQTATTRFAWATTLAVTITAIGGPVLGLIADQRAIKKRLLAGFMIVGVIATALMALIGRGDDGAHLGRADVESDQVSFSPRHSSPPVPLVRPAP